MPENPKQELVEQAVTNAQTVQFVADREAEIASQADGLAEKQPEFSAIAALEREHRKRLMEVALEEKRMATAIQFGAEPPESLAARAREHRKELLEVARAEARLSEGLEVREALGEEKHPTVAVLAEQAQRNRDLLRHVAATDTEANSRLRAGLSEEPDISASATPKK